MSVHDRNPRRARRGGTRRHFLTRSVPAALGGFWLAGQARSQTRPALGANEALRVGLIGCGHRGPYLAYVFQSTPGVRVIALCDVYEQNLQKAAEQMHHLGERPALYRDFRQLIDDPQLDAVIVATNVHWHALPAITACQAGKDVYLEKPVAYSVAEGRAVLEAARRHGRIVQMGTQQHTWEHYREAVELIRSGALGEISQVRVWDVRPVHLRRSPETQPPRGLDWDFWLGPAPIRDYDANRHLEHDWFFDYSGGWQLVWGVHHMDIVHWAMGVTAPLNASARGGKFAFADDPREWPDTFEGVCEYGPGPVARNGFLMSYVCRTGSGRPIEGRHYGKCFYGTQGSLVLSREGFAVYPDSQTAGAPAERVVQRRDKEHDAVLAHVRSFVDRVRDRRSPEADIEAGHRASNPGHLMNIAWRVGRPVRWDAHKEQIIDDAEANALLTREYRSPWALPA